MVRLLAFVVVTVLSALASACSECADLADCPSGKICSAEGTCVADTVDHKTGSTVNAEGEGEGDPPPPGQCGVLGSQLRTDTIYVLGELRTGGSAIAPITDLDSYAVGGLVASGSSLQVQSTGQLIYARPDPNDFNRRKLRTFIFDDERFSDPDGDGQGDCVYPTTPLGNDTQVFTGCGVQESVEYFVIQQGGTDVFAICYDDALGQYSVKMNDGSAPFADAGLYSIPVAFNSSRTVLGIDVLTNEFSVSVDSIDNDTHTPVAGVELPDQYLAVARATPGGFMVVGIQYRGLPEEQWVLYDVSNSGTASVRGAYQKTDDLALGLAVLDSNGALFVLGGPGLSQVLKLELGVPPVVVADDADGALVRVSFGRLFTGDANVGF